MKPQTRKAGYMVIVLWDWNVLLHNHYSDVTMSAMPPQITGILTVCSTVCLVHTTENIKAQRHWPLWGESNGYRWTLLTISPVLLGRCYGNPLVTGEFPSQRDSNVFPCHDVTMHWQCLGAGVYFHTTTVKYDNTHPNIESSWPISFGYPYAIGYTTADIGHTREQHPRHKHRGSGETFQDDQVENWYRVS